MDSIQESIHFFQTTNGFIYKEAQPTDTKLHNLSAEERLVYQCIEQSADKGSVSSLYLQFVFSESAFRNMDRRFEVQDKHSANNASENPSQLGKEEDDQVGQAYRSTLSLSCSFFFCFFISCIVFRRSVPAATASHPRHLRTKHAKCTCLRTLSRRAKSPAAVGTQTTSSTST